MGLGIRTSLVELSEYSDDESLIFQNYLTAFTSKGFKADNLNTKVYSLDTTTGLALNVSIFASLGITDVSKVTGVFISGMIVPQSASEIADSVPFNIVATIGGSDRALGTFCQIELLQVSNPPTEIKLSNVIVPASSLAKIFILVSTKN